MNEKKTPWMSVSNIWKKIAAVIAAVGVLATLVVKIFNTPEKITYISFAVLGLIFLMISWYVDVQAKYTYEDIEKCKTKVFERFEAHEKEAEGKVNSINQTMSILKQLATDTRKDTVRIQLLMMMKDQPENHDSILKIAELYFVELDGDWYMTSEFKKWAKAQKVDVPADIHVQMDKNHKD